MHTDSYSILLESEYLVWSSLHLRKTFSLQFGHEKIVAEDKSNFIFNLVKTQLQKNSKFNSEMTSLAAIFGMSDVL